MRCGNMETNKIVRETKKLLTEKYRRAGIENVSESMSYRELSRKLKIHQNVLEDILEEKLLKKGWAYEPVSGRIAKIDWKRVYEDVDAD